MRQPNSFLTQAYKTGYVHTWITSTGKEKAQAQFDYDVKEFPTVIGCKRWITKQEQRALDDNQRKYIKVVGFARNRYTRNGELIIHHRNREHSKYTIIEQLAWNKYMAGGNSNV